MCGGVGQAEEPDCHSAPPPPPGNGTLWPGPGVFPQVWFGALADPEGLLLALKQEAARAHGDAAWAVDALALKFTLRPMGPVDRLRPMPDGVWLTGLMGDGLMYDMHYGRVFEPPEVLLDWKGQATHPMAPVLVTAVRATPDPPAGPAAGAWRCPVYDTPQRGRMLTHVELPCDEDPHHWDIRGACLYATQAPFWPDMELDPGHPVLECGQAVPITQVFAPPAGDEGACSPAVVHRTSPVRALGGQGGGGGHALRRSL